MENQTALKGPVTGELEAAVLQPELGNPSDRIEFTATTGMVQSVTQIPWTMKTVKNFVGSSRNLSKRESPPRQIDRMNVYRPTETVVNTVRLLHDDEDRKQYV